MIKRLQKLDKKHSFFLFGARGTGKTTLLEQTFSKKQNLWINLLSFREESRFRQDPDLLTQLIEESSYKKVIIDEVQKIPKLLDIVHLEIEKNKNIQFILTGSSARKLKKERANMLAGRLFTFTLHPLTHLEWRGVLNMQSVLETGALPMITQYNSVQKKSRYLESYIQTYLKEEVLAEQLTRKIKPFKDFLDIAAQCNGQIINYSKIARELRVDYTTVQTYFDILIDTYLGFYLKSFHRSIRKQQNQAPKFFLFDTGIVRAILNQSKTPLKKGSFEYGKSFEHFIILELIRLNIYYEKNLRISYLRDKNGQEIDLIIQKPTGEEILVEIKSSDISHKEQVKVLKKFSSLWDRPCTAQLWSNDTKNRTVDGICYYYWKTALKKIIS